MHARDMGPRKWRQRLIQNATVTLSVYLTASPIRSALAWSLVIHRATPAAIDLSRKLTVLGKQRTATSHSLLERLRLDSEG